MLAAQRVVLLPGRGPDVRIETVPIKYSRRCKNISKLTIPATLAITLGWANVAIGDVGSEGWGRNWATSGSSYNRSYNRSRGRKWESQPNKGFPTLSKSNIAPLNAAIKRYQGIVARGGWQPVPMVKLKPGVRHQGVALLRRRLELTGDLPARSRPSRRFDYYLDIAVKRFQVRHGLTPSGVVGRATILALNVPAKERLSQLRTNLVRLRTLSRKASKKYVVVNIPAAQIEAVENDEIVSRHAAVVGKLDRRTPLLSSNIHQINFNPFWHVPQSIVRKDLVPKARLYARRNKDILTEYRIDAFTGSGRKLDPRRINWNSPAVYGYAYRQRPWKDNSMGFVKINFHNKHSVYMHDTPSKSLFGRNYRAASSGCVRVQNVKQLISWLLAANQGWSGAQVAEMERNGTRKDVNLKRRVPVYFVYVTAWATKDGTINFRRDLYARDRVGPMASAY